MSRRTLTPGKRYRVIFEGTAKTLATLDGFQERLILDGGGPGRYITGRLLDSAIEVEEAAPAWQPGDVVVIRFHGPTSKPWTYVRGIYAWPGDRRMPKTDEEISRLYAEGKVEHVLRDGKPVR